MKRNSAQNMADWPDTACRGEPFPEPLQKRGREFYDYNDRMGPNKPPFDYNRGQPPVPRDYNKSGPNQPPGQFHYPPHNAPEPYPKAPTDNMTTIEKLKMMDELLDGLICTEAEATVATNIMNFLTKNLLHYKIQTLPPSIEDNVSRFGKRNEKNPGVLTKTIIGGGLPKLGNIAGMNPPQDTDLNKSSMPTSTGNAAGPPVSGKGAPGPNPMTIPPNPSGGNIPPNPPGSVQMGAPPGGKGNIPGNGNELYQQRAGNSQAKTRWDNAQKKDGAGLPLPGVSNATSLPPNTFASTSAPTNVTSGNMNWGRRGDGSLGPNPIYSNANMPPSGGENMQTYPSGSGQMGPKASNEMYERRDPNSQGKPPFGQNQQNIQGQNPAGGFAGGLPGMNWEVGRKGELGSNPLYTNANMSAYSGVNMQSNQLGPGQMGHSEMKRGIPSSGGEFYERREAVKPPVEDEGSKPKSIPGLTLMEGNDGGSSKATSGDFPSGSSAVNWGQREGLLGSNPSSYNKGNMNAYQLGSGPTNTSAQEQGQAKSANINPLSSTLAPNEISDAVNTVLSMYGRGNLQMNQPGSMPLGAPAYEQNSAKFTNTNAPSTQTPTADSAGGSPSLNWGTRRDGRQDPPQGYGYPNPQSYERDYAYGNRSGPMHGENYPGSGSNMPGSYGGGAYPAPQSYRY